MEQTFKTAPQFKQFCKKLTTSQRAQIIEAASTSGLKWNKSDIFKVNWMRCAMSINEFLNAGNDFKVLFSDSEDKVAVRVVLPSEENKTKREAKEMSNFKELSEDVDRTYRELQDGTIIIGEGYKTFPGTRGGVLGCKGHIRLDHIVGNAPWGMGHFIAIDNSYEDNKLVSSQLNGHYDRSSRRWYIPFGQVLDVLKLFKHIEISKGIAPTIKEVIAKVDIKKVDTDTMRYEKTEQIKFNASMSLGSELQPHEYQKRGIEFLLKSKRALLGYSVGLGKTLVSILAANHLLNTGKTHRVLVIAPLNVKTNWEREIKKTGCEEVAVVRSRDLRRDMNEAIRRISLAKYVIINFEMLRNPKFAAHLKQYCPDVVIVDEAHKLKDRNSQQTKVFNKFWSSAVYKWFLTATPFPNAKPKETFTMLEHLRPDITGDWLKFLNRFVETETIYTKYGEKQKPKRLKNLQELKELIKDFVLIKTYKDRDVKVNLPTMRHVSYLLDMESTQERVYKGILNKVKSGKLENMSTLEMLGNLKKLESVSLDPDIVSQSGDVDLNHLFPKEAWTVDTIMSHLSDENNKGIVVFCEYKLPLKKVRHALVREGINADQIGVITGDERTPDAEKLFNSGHLKVLLCTSAAEEGLNLQKGGDAMIHMDVSWVPKTVTQREGRIARQGSESEILVIHTPIMSGTVEDNKRKTLQNKTTTIEEILGDDSAGSVKHNLQADRLSVDLTSSDFREILSRDVYA